MATAEASELRSLFVDEAREYIQLLNQGLLQLESAPQEAAVLHELFRAVHSLKGMAGTMGYQSMVELAHAVESVFDELRSETGTISPTP
ncbi:MAG: Hpt domain-containing protein, partial [Bacillota bacterium]